MPLTDTAIKSAKPKSKTYKLSDSGGLYLFVNQTGKYFRMDYRFEGKRKTLSIGVYPSVSLKEARQKCIDAHSQLQNRVDPSQFKQEADLKQKAQTQNQFEFVAREWFVKNKSIWKESHSEKIIRRLETNVFPYFSDKDVSSITAPMILVVLQRIETKGIIETAHRVKQILGQIFRYAIITGRAEHDPSADLKGALTPHQSKHMATITEPLKVGELLKTIDSYKGSFIVKCALQLASLTFVRPGELRHAEWKEFDVDKALWKIPSDKMKMSRTHIVPLSKQAINILNDIRPITGNGRYLFPSVRTIVRPISVNTVNGALRRLGFEKAEMTGHGFRAMASTLLHENSWQSHLIELQLAHVERNSVKAAYNHALYLEERVNMMQWWADYLDSLKATLSNNR